MRYFPTEVYVSESVLNSSYVYSVIETSKEVLAVDLMLTFLSRATSPPSFTFFRIKVTPQYSTYFFLKNITKIFLKKLVDDILQYSSQSLNLCQTLSKSGNDSIFTKNVEKRWQYFGDMAFGNR